MKIGTDGVLLGAWTPIDNNPFSILDIGAGTGILSLMLAQRSNAEQIDAIEIEENAFEQCVDNFENSPWNDRLYCYHASVEEFVEEMKELHRTCDMTCTICDLRYLVLCFFIICYLCPTMV